MATVQAIRWRVGEGDGKDFVPPRFKLGVECRAHVQLESLESGGSTEIHWIGLNRSVSQPLATADISWLLAAKVGKVIEQDCSAECLFSVKPPSFAWGSRSIVFLGCFLWQRKEPPRQPVISFWQKHAETSLCAIYSDLAWFRDVWWCLVWCSDVRKKSEPSSSKSCSLKFVPFPAHNSTCSGCPQARQKCGAYVYIDLYDYDHGIYLYNYIYIHTYTCVSSAVYASLPTLFPSTDSNTYWHLVPISFEIGFTVWSSEICPHFFVVFWLCATLCFDELEDSSARLRRYAKKLCWSLWIAQWQWPPCWIRRHYVTNYNGFQCEFHSMPLNYTYELHLTSLS